MPAGVAAGHPATAEVALRTLVAGGSAADAAIAAMLASCVGESVLTGIGGGGFATYFDAASSEATCLDFFCSIPGLEAERQAAPMVPIEVNFGDAPLQYMIGGASVAVPGIPAGAAELHRRWGRLPWQQVVQPAVTLAASGAVLPAAQARALAAVAQAMLPAEGAQIYAPNGRLLQGGDLLFHPGLDTAMAVLAEEGPAEFYEGWVGERMVAAVQAAGGTLSRADLAAYRVLQVPVAHAPLAGRTVSARHDLNRTIRTIAALPPELPAMDRGTRAVALANALLAYGRDHLGDTTNISVVDAAGDACVITTTLGLGSGVWVPGLGIHLNSMLGEGELITPGMLPGQRMSSMMCPLVVVDGNGSLVLAAGSAGASRIRTALVETLIGVLIDGLDATAAIGAPRFHPVAGGASGEPPLIRAELDYFEEELTALAAAGYKISRWDHLSHYFGGVSAVGNAGAAGDPRRGGVGMLAAR